VLPREGAGNSWLGGVGVILTAVYAAGILARPERRVLRLGIDSWMVILLYAAAIGGLVAVAQ
jgi:cation:H+ antiporter